MRPPSALEAKILEQRTGIEGERKQVTVMYTDIVGSMDLARVLSDERWGLVLDRFLGVAASAVHRFEGTVNHFTGDGLMAVFGAPMAYEDHARRACLAVLELHRGVAALAAELADVEDATISVRCGLNSGEVLVGSIGDDVHMDFVPIGNTTALGKRIEALAPAGSTAISASTASLIDGEFELRDLGEFELKGAEASHRVFELIGPGLARSRLSGLASTRGLSPFVGRAAERAVIEALLEQSRAGQGRAIGIVGEPGVGKSRLVRELVAGWEGRGFEVTSAGGVGHARYVPFLPVLALFRDYFDIDAAGSPEAVRKQIETVTLAADPELAGDLPLLFEFLGVADANRTIAPGDPETHRRQLLDAALRAILGRPREEVAVVVMEDLQWIDEGTAAFLDDLVDAAVGTRVVVICTYRPEYEPPWLRRASHVQISLGPLDSDACDELLGELLGRDRSLEPLASRIADRGGGNPFFTEEIVRALVDKGHLEGMLGAYRLGAELEAVVLPATVQAGLAARIDRLPSREKAVVQTMSVIGDEIPGHLLHEVCGLGESQLAESLALLVRAQLVVPRGSSGSGSSGSGSSGGGEYLFKHPLAQEVAYGSQVSERRMRAHRKVAVAIERTYPARLDEHAALLAHHCRAAGDKLGAARWHARAAATAEVTSPADAMRHWRLVRDLATELGVPERDELATRSRTGLLAVAWRLGLAPEEAAAIHAQGHSGAVSAAEASSAATLPQGSPPSAGSSSVRAGMGRERLLLDLNYAATLMHNGHERDGLTLFRDVSRRAVAAGDPDMAMTPALGVSYAAWIAGTLHEAMAVIDHALHLAGGNAKTGAGVGFVSPYSHAFMHRGQALGFMGDLAAARRDFHRGFEVARKHGDAEVESFGQGNLAMVEAHAGENEAALSAAVVGLEIAERTSNPIAVIANSAPSAMAEVAAGRFASALTQAESNLAAIREQRVGLYYEPLLLATIARCSLGLGDPDRAMAAAEEAVEIMEARGLAACALSAPIVLAHVLLSTRGAAAAQQIETVLRRAERRARECQAHIFGPQIDRLARELSDPGAGRSRQRRAQT